MERKEKSKCRLNFSKPLAILMATLLLLPMLMPWFKLYAKYEVGGINVFNFNIEASIFSIQQRFGEILELLQGYAGIAGVNVADYQDLIWTTNGILLLVTAFFMLIALNILLFGVIGMLSGRKARYFFGRIGGTLLIIATFSVIIIGVFGGLYLKDMMSMVDSSYGIDISFGITIWPAILFVLALVFRIWGIKLLRRLNYNSAIAHGKNDIAESERKMLCNE